MNDQTTVLGAPNMKLDRECQAFSAYLIRQRPNEYVLAKYREAHDVSGIVGRNEGRLLDRMLVNAATAHPIGAKLVDAYTAIFYKRSAVRSKWILLLAILESCAPTYGYFDEPDAGSKAWLAARLLWQGTGFILALGLSMILFMPAHLVRIAYSIWTK